MIAGLIETPLSATSPLPLACTPGTSVRALAERQRFRLPVVAVLNGAPLMRSGWDVELGEGDRLLFLVLPAGGGGMKDIFRSVIQIAITITAAYFLGPGGLGLSGWQLGAAVAATTVASGYLLNAILPPPRLGGSFSVDSASPTYSLQAQGNQARLGAPIPRLYGHHIFQPDFAAQPYTEYAGNDLFLYQLFSLGLGQYQLHKIFIEDTELWNEDAGLTGNFSDIDFEIVEPGGQVTLFPANVISSVEVSGQTLEGPAKGGGWIGPYVANPAGTAANFLAIDYVWPSGACTVGDDGGLGAVIAQLRAEARKIDDAGAPLGDWFLLGEDNFSYATRTPQRVSLRFAVPSGRYEARVKRVNDMADDSRTFGSVQWAGLRAYIESTGVFPKETVLAMRMRATDQLSSQSARRVRTLQTSKLPLWTGAGWSAPAATRDIFPIAADMLRNAVYGGGLPDRRIDIATLEALHETWTARGDTFDAVFDTRKLIWVALADVLRVGRAQPVMIGDVVSAVRDEKKLAPRAFFTPRNIVRGSFSAEYALFDPDAPDDVVVQYMDSTTWRMSEVSASLPGSAAAKPATTQLFGCTDRTRAWRYGMYQAAVNRYRRIFPALTTELDGRVLRRGDLTVIAHPLADWGQTADVTGFDAAARRVTLSADVTFGAGVNFMLLRRRDGRAWGPVIVTAGGTAREAVADAGDLAEVIAEQGDWAEIVVTDGGMEPTAAVIGSGPDFARDCLVVAARPQGADRVALTLVVDDDRVYEADEGDPPPVTSGGSLPQPEAGPAVSGLAVDVQGSPLAPVLVASVQPSPGAESYIWQTSYDFVTWETRQAGPSRTWQGEVRPGPVWLRVTAFGRIAGAPGEWFRDMTVSQAQPAAPGAIGVTAFAQHAWIDFTLAPSDILAGVIVKVSAATGFDPETEGIVQYDGPPAGRVLVGLGVTGTVYARIAAYNIYGKTGLNWSSEIKIDARGIDTAALSPSLAAAFENAEVLPEGAIFRVDNDGNIAGLAIVQDGALNAVTAAFLVDVFQVRLPGGGSAALFEVTEDGVFIDTAFIRAITADEINAVWGDFVDIRSGRWRGPAATGNNWDFNAADGYISLKRPAP